MQDKHLRTAMFLWQVILPKLKTYINIGNSFQYWLGFTLSYDGFEN